MNLFLFTLFLFGFALLVHIAWWRIALPRRQLPALLRLFIIVFGLVGALAWAAGHFSICPWVQTLAFADWLTVAFFYGSLSICYLITFPAIEAHSPTLSLIYALSKRGENGMSHEEVRAFLERFQFISARMEALVADGFLVKSGDLLTLPERSYFLFRVLLVYRKVILGIRNSGG